VGLLILIKKVLLIFFFILIFYRLSLNSQIRELLEKNPEKHTELLEVFKKFRDEEQEHHDTGLANDAEQAPGYKVLSETIKAGCRAAVWVAERV
jgi:ubiquinone biosynthesis monooxygenase Coq7